MYVDKDLRAYFIFSFCTKKNGNVGLTTVIVGFEKTSESNWTEKDKQELIIIHYLVVVSLSHL